LKQPSAGRATTGKEEAEVALASLISLKSREGQVFSRIRYSKSRNAEEVDTTVCQYPLVVAVVVFSHGSTIHVDKQHLETLIDETIFTF
jgi:hypothetical protein